MSARARHSRSAAHSAKSAVKKTVSLVAALAAIVAVWALAACLVRKPFLPYPWSACAALRTRIEDGSLALHLGATAKRVGIALAIAAPLATGIGLASGRSKSLDAFVSPFVYLLHPLPKVAFLPIIMLFLGLGDAAKVFLIALIIFGQLLVSARDAARALPQSFVDSMRSLGASRADIARHVVFPYALPALLSALRVGLGTAVAVLFIAETFASETGLGWYIVDAWTRVDYPDMYAAIIALSLFGLGCYLMVDVAEAAFCRWRDVD